MGSRVEPWPPDRLKDMAAFFSQVGYKPTREWKEEVRLLGPAPLQQPGRQRRPREAGPRRSARSRRRRPAADRLGPQTAVFPDGTKVTLSAGPRPAEVFADWLITPRNPWFTRAIVNRVWYWLLGRGIIHEPDDIRDDNPPSNPELLAYLEKELVASGYDLKRLYRLIATSEHVSAFLDAAVERSRRPQASFASYPLRRLDAEVLIDAINKITGTTDLYTSPIPEPFTYIPADKPAIAIADGSITSPFLTLFGRSARATGLENERDNKPVPAQWLHMLNSSHIQRKLEQGPGSKTHLRLRPQAGRDRRRAVPDDSLPPARRRRKRKTRYETGSRPCPVRLAPVRDVKLDRHRLGPDQQPRVPLPALRLLGAG